jgi:cobalt-zinc-cadmium efflux system outer membrane protein
MIKRLTLIVGFAVILLAGCASSPERALRASYVETEQAVYSASPASETQPRFDEMSTLDKYLQHAFSHNPGLRAAFDRWKAAMERIPQSRALENPELSFEYFIEQMDTRYQASLTQTFPAFGKLALREGQAAEEAETARYSFETERLDLYDRVSKAFYEYDYLRRVMAVTDENFRLLADLEAVVMNRYKAGLAPFSDLIKTQVEKDRMANDLESLRDERLARSSELASVLNLPVFDVLAWPDASPSGPAIVDLDVLDAMLADLNPELKAADAMLAAAQYQVKLARKRALPDFMLGAGWMVSPGIDGRGDESDVSLMAGITLPLWRGRYRAEIQEAEATRQAASREREDMRNQLKAELSMASFKFRDAERRIGLFTKSLVPKACQALEVARQEFSTGKAEFMTLIDAQRTLLEFRLMLERATADREIALAEIGCCIGKYDGVIERDATSRVNRNGAPDDAGGGKDANQEQGR